ncbi:class I SAM-dependent methyltransferase [Oceanobacillus kapialis]|uniref:class I SAM-dependent methyltransferase n=1 Tax=Oceanobacillus kapialis TaxID=481353 RepID=UPI00384F98A6
MAIHFHDERNKYSYTTRNADEYWVDTMRDLLSGEFIQQAADIGCGGGIYSKALCELGIPNVLGIDYSISMLEGAKENCRKYPQIKFKQGNATALELESDQLDLILERALIHHFSDLNSCFTEAYRVLKHGGTFVLQDRTLQNVFQGGNEEHIRGWFFACYPHLIDKEVKRRFNSRDVNISLEEAGFEVVKELTILEKRQVYKEKNQLLNDIRQRTGRSILHELSDVELDKLINFISARLPDQKSIIEKDYWTIWKAIKR